MLTPAAVFVGVAVGVVVGAVAWMASARMVRELAAARDDAARARTLTILQLLTPALAAAQSDPRALLVWQPIARTVRELFPDECARIDRAAGAIFPFDAERVQAAHARWTADWLAWERAHDAEYKGKAAVAEDALATSGGAVAARVHADAIEREKLDRYQRKYEEYIRVARALQEISAKREDSRSAKRP
jgi:hypothetical protein